MSAPMEDKNLFERLLECKNEKILTIKQSYIGDVGCVVWDAALVLSKYIESKGFSDRFGEIKGKKVVELGAGTGAVGLVAATKGALVKITDLADFIPLMQMNIDCNQDVLEGPATAMELKWGGDVSKFLPHPNLILMSDCIYYMEALDGLVKTMDDLSNKDTHILCCYEERTIGQNVEAQRKFTKLVEAIFTVNEVPLAEQDAEYRSMDIHILHLMKR
ncbi:protein N-lysine methyltransferase METTL21D-like [Amphiura filiformis]|uniref:protein N-lysine methyltransferase METTL21D-like n=1 Tax=Amphiura filiformis TaxID=82378 RepID=UPI003B225F52